MKRIRITCCMLFLVLAFSSLTGCGNRNDMNSNGTTAQTQSGAETVPSSGETGGAGMTGGNGGTTTNGGTENGGSPTGATRAGEETGGVINGLMNDVERGVENITGETAVTETTRGQ